MPQRDPSDYYTNTPPRPPVYTPPSRPGLPRPGASTGSAYDPEAEARRRRQAEERARRAEQQRQAEEHAAALQAQAEAAAARARQAAVAPQASPRYHPEADPANVAGPQAAAPPLPAPLPSLPRPNTGSAYSPEQQAVQRQQQAVSLEQARAAGRARAGQYYQQVAPGYNPQRDAGSARAPGVQQGSVYQADSRTLQTRPGQYESPAQALLQGVAAVQEPYQRHVAQPVSRFVDEQANYVTGAPRDYPALAAGLATVDDTLGRTVARLPRFLQAGLPTGTQGQAERIRQGYQRGGREQALSQASLANQMGSQALTDPLTYVAGGAGLLGRVAPRLARVAHASQYIADPTQLAFDPLLAGALRGVGAVSRGVRRGIERATDAMGSPGAYEAFGITPERPVPGTPRRRINPETGKVYQTLPVQQRVSDFWQQAEPRLRRPQQAAQRPTAAAPIRQARPPRELPETLVEHAPGLAPNIQARDNLNRDWWTLQRAIEQEPQGTRYRQRLEELQEEARLVLAAEHGHAPSPRSPWETRARIYDQGEAVDRFRRQGGTASPTQPTRLTREQQAAAQQQLAMFNLQANPLSEVQPDQAPRTAAEPPVQGRTGTRYIRDPETGAVRAIPFNDQRSQAFYDTVSSEHPWRKPVDPNEAVNILGSDIAEREQERIAAGLANRERPGTPEVATLEDMSPYYDRYNDVEETFSKEEKEAADLAEDLSKASRQQWLYHAPTRRIPATATSPAIPARGEYFSRNGEPQSPQQVEAATQANKELATRFDNVNPDPFSTTDVSLPSAGEVARLRQPQGAWFGAARYEGAPVPAAGHRVEQPLLPRPGTAAPVPQPGGGPSPYPDYTPEEWRAFAEDVSVHQHRPTIPPWPGRRYGEGDLLTAAQAAEQQRLMQLNLPPTESVAGNFSVVGPRGSDPVQASLFGPEADYPRQPPQLPGHWRRSVRPSQAPLLRSRPLQRLSEARRSGVFQDPAYQAWREQRYGIPRDFSTMTLDEIEAITGPQAPAERPDLPRPRGSSGIIAGGNDEAGHFMGDPRDHPDNTDYYKQFLEDMEPDQLRQHRASVLRQIDAFPRRELTAEEDAALTPLLDQLRQIDEALPEPPYIEPNEDGGFLAQDLMDPQDMTPGMHWGQGTDAWQRLYPDEPPLPQGQYGDIRNSIMAGGGLADVPPQMPENMLWSESRGGWFKNGKFMGPGDPNTPPITPPYRHPSGRSAAEENAFWRSLQESMQPEIAAGRGRALADAREVTAETPPWIRPEATASGYRDPARDARLNQRDAAAQRMNENSAQLRIDNRNARAREGKAAAYPETRPEYARGRPAAFQAPTAATPPALARPGVLSRAQDALQYLWKVAKGDLETWVDLAHNKGLDQYMQFDANGNAIPPVLFKGQRTLRDIIGNAGAPNEGELRGRLFGNGAAQDQFGMAAGGGRRGRGRPKAAPAIPNERVSESFNPEGELSGYTVEHLSDDQQLIQDLHVKEANASLTEAELQALNAARYRVARVAGTPRGIAAQRAQQDITLRNNSPDAQQQELDRQVRDAVLSDTDYLAGQVRLQELNLKRGEAGLSETEQREYNQIQLRLAQAREAMLPQQQLITKAAVVRAQRELDAGPIRRGLQTFGETTKALTIPLTLGALLLGGGEVYLRWYFTPRQQDLQAHVNDMDTHHVINMGAGQKLVDQGLISPQDLMQAHRAMDAVPTLVSGQPDQPAQLKAGLDAIDTALARNGHATVPNATPTATPGPEYTQAGALIDQWAATNDPKLKLQIERRLRAMADKNPALLDATGTYFGPNDTAREGDQRRLGNVIQTTPIIPPTQTPYRRWTPTPTPTLENPARNAAYHDLTAGIDATEPWAPSRYDAEKALFNWLKSAEGAPFRNRTDLKAYWDRANPDQSLASWYAQAKMGGSTPTPTSGPGGGGGKVLPILARPGGAALRPFRQSDVLDLSDRHPRPAEPEPHRPPPVPPKPPGTATGADPGAGDYRPPAARPPASSGGGSGAGTPAGSGRSYWAAPTGNQSPWRKDPITGAWKVFYNGAWITPAQGGGFADEPSGGGGAAGPSGPPDDYWSAPKAGKSLYRQDPITGEWHVWYNNQWVIPPDAPEHEPGGTAAARTGPIPTLYDPPRPGDSPLRQFPGIGWAGWDGQQWVALEGDSAAGSTGSAGGGYRRGGGGGGGGFRQPTTQEGATRQVNGKWQSFTAGGWRNQLEQYSDLAPEDRTLLGLYMAGSLSQDQLTGLARKYGVTVARLLELLDQNPKWTMRPTLPVRSRI